jgi:Plant transposon protein
MEDLHVLVQEDSEDYEVSMTFLSASVLIYSFLESERKRLAAKRDHRTLPRKKRRVFDHARALQCIRADLTGPDALFVGKDFKMFFRISRARFQEMLETFASRGGSFYSGNSDCCRNATASLEAKLLLPLQTLAFGVATHAFCMYYQMSYTLAASSCRMFNKTYLKLYRKKYMKRPNKLDVVRISKLHETVHGVPGMFGSLDCMHTQWKNCPMGWQGSFKGRAGHPSIVLEAACDHHCYFWHLDYGHAGTNSDINILKASDFYHSFLDGRMEELEADAVPYSICSEEFTKLFVLTDGAYPQFDRFVKPLKYPVLPEECKYSDWQAACRKDIERAFGILQNKFQSIARPIQLQKLVEVAEMVKTCLC